MKTCNHKRRPEAGALQPGRRWLNLFLFCWALALSGGVLAQNPVTHELAQDVDQAEPVVDPSASEDLPQSSGGVTVAGPEEEAPASISVYVFRDGRPAEGINVEVGDKVNRLTGPNGGIEENLLPQLYYMVISEDGITYHSELITLSPGEIMQVIVTLGEPGQVPAVSYETSHPDDASGDAGAASGSASVADAPEPGTLRGQVVSIEDGSPIAGARIFLSGTPLDLRTDDEGRYEVVVNAGTYSISILSSDFATRTQDGVEVIADQVSEQNFELTPAGLELAEFVVVTPYIQGSLASVIGERRDSADVTDVIGAAQISRAGDSDAAGALKRVTGLTIVGGRFVYVRGLGERYSSTLLNSAVVPSPDPTRRVVPLDLFPTDVIKSISVQKTFSPNLPGDFAGGAVEIRTLGRPEEAFFTAEAGVGYNSETTFKDGLRYDGGNRDWLGIDDGTRELPDSLAIALADGSRLEPRTPFNPEGFEAEEIAEFGRDLAGVYNIIPERIGPDAGASFSGGTPFSLFGRDWGVTASLSWDQKWRTREEQRTTFGISGDGTLFPTKDGTVTRTVRAVGLSGFLNIEGEIADGHVLSNTNMILRQTTDEAKLDDSFDDGLGRVIRRYELEWIENELVSNQLGGDHKFGLGSDVLGPFGVTWQYTRATADRDSPNERRYRFDESADGTFRYSDRADNNQTIFSKLVDNSDNYGIGLDLPWNINDDNAITFRVGIADLSRDRDSVIRRFDFNDPRQRPPGLFERPFLEDIINDETIGIGSDQFSLSETTLATDTYVATQELDAAYGTLDIKFLSDWRIVAGARREDNLLRVSTFDLFAPDNAIESEIDTSDTLPALSVTRQFGDSSQLRFCYSETVNRPDFRELSPSPYTDPARDVDFVGNPDLQPAAITNFDARWETYFTPTEQLSVAVFYKEFEMPIETVVVPGGTRLLTLANAESAENLGVEFDFYKELGFAREWAWAKDWTLLDYMYFTGNLAWIDSTVTLGDANQIQTTDNRPLQGQSPWVANFQLGYDDPDSGLTATLLMNIFGERIVEVGTLGRPDVYEEPFPQLDFVVSYDIKENASLKFKFQNILDPTAEETQGDQIARSFKRGRNLSLSIKFEF